MIAGKKILVGVLNWGLGHASRSACLIKQLDLLKAEIVIASDGAALEFLRREFPDKDSLRLPNPRVHYDSALGLQWSIFAQLPKLMKVYREERSALDGYLRDHQVDLIISDNRYGLYSTLVPSVLLTHQLNLQSRLGTAVLAKVMRSLVGHFDQLWVPDEQAVVLSGVLSSLRGISRPIKYIGVLSHFGLLGSEAKGAQYDKKDRYLAILSGPEPARSKFEKRLVHLAKIQKIPLSLVQGSHSAALHNQEELIQCIPLANTQELYTLIQTHKGIVCRSAYSSIMDLSYLGKQALMVPTPGQSEQEYLAKLHHAAKHFYTVLEKEIDLKRDLQRAFTAEFRPPSPKLDLSEQRELIKKYIQELI